MLYEIYKIFQGHHKVPDLESIITSIRQAWNTPNNLSAVHK